MGDNQATEIGLGNIFAEYEVMTLSARDREVFVTALLNAPAPAMRLRKAVDRYKKHQHRAYNTQ